MQLSQDTSRFVEQVAASRISGNLDAPEGGFDAVVQSVVCKDKIGWRDKSRKLLVFSTDSGFHYAGDGKVSTSAAPHLHHELIVSSPIVLFLFLAPVSFLLLWLISHATECTQTNHTHMHSWEES
jgi:hypothetical protein